MQAEEELDEIMSLIPLFNSYLRDNCNLLQLSGNIKDTVPLYLK